MSSLEHRVPLGLYYIEELAELSRNDRTAYLRARRKIIKQYLLQDTPEDPRLWPDYLSVMHTELRKRLEEMFPQLLAQWHILRTKVPIVEATYQAELQARRRLHTTNVTRLKRRAKLATLRKLGRDPRTLGKFETVLFGQATYGYDSN